MRIQAMSSPTQVTFQPGQRGLHHGQVGLAAGAGEGAGDVVGLALGRGEAQDEHVLGQPALLAGHGRGDAQGQALLAQQGVAAVARAVRPDGRLVGEVHDVLVLGIALARPGHVVLERGQRRADGVQAGDELAVGAERLEHRACPRGS